MSDCQDCKKASEVKHYGCYDFECLDCCARLVASARPHRRQQESMLAAIARVEGSPKRKEILERIKNI